LIIWLAEPSEEGNVYSPVTLIVLKLPVSPIISPLALILAEDVILPVWNNDPSVFINPSLT